MIYINFPLIRFYLDIGKIFLKPITISSCILAVLCFFQNLESVINFSQHAFLWIAKSFSTVKTLTYLTLAIFLETIIISVLFPFKVLYKVVSFSVNTTVLALQKFIIYASWVLDYQKTLQAWSLSKKSSVYNLNSYDYESCFQNFPSVTGYIYCLDGKVQLIWHFGELEHLTPIFNDQYIEADGEKISFNVNGKSTKVQQIVGEYFHDAFSTNTQLFRCNQIFKLYCLSGIKTDFFPGLLEYETSTGELRIAQKESIEQACDENDPNDTYADTDYWKSIFEDEPKMILEWSDETEINNDEKNGDVILEEIIQEINSEKLSENLKRNLLPVTEDSTEDTNLVSTETTSFENNININIKEYSNNIKNELEGDYGNFKTHDAQEVDLENLFPILPTYEQKIDSDALKKDSILEQTEENNIYGEDIRWEDDPCFLPIIPIYEEKEERKRGNKRKYKERDILSPEPKYSIDYQEEKGDGKDMFSTTNRLIFECLEHMRENWGLDNTVLEEEDSTLSELKLEERNRNAQEPDASAVNNIKKAITFPNGGENIRPFYSDSDTSDDEEDEDEGDERIMKLEDLFYEPFDDDYDDSNLFLQQKEHSSSKEGSHKEEETMKDGLMEIDDLQFMDEEKNKTLKMQLCMSFIAERFLQPSQTDFVEETQCR
ncbi:uncharacterized protein SOCG_03456 [Schizosaccharomyces octosporus yFS286]|uniref:Uncharacterized protein n=1 Tax=Schizosaccharomyces octosporus (strain yFS286) TaxID=483514 RepID=S9RJU3_SCHOY|nr:uncharacterized protein SOCG_03456 [Schizosaccharomyces octosporus yFS286]EPX74244.1 hypothetical protein SOCG_03456 [Schizosaccharomyces octosporus yFS286]